MTTRTWSGVNGSYSDATQWSGGAVPTTGDVAVISSGTVNAANLTASGVEIDLNGNSTAAGTLALSSVTLASSSTLAVSDSNAFGATLAPTLTLSGTVTNNGSITFSGSQPVVTFATGASLVNGGSIVLNGASPQVQTAANAVAGSVVNNGTITVNNPTAGYQSAIVNATISGTGTISISNAGALSLRQSVSNGQTVAFNNTTTANSALEIDAPGAFGATVSGFVSSDRLILTSIPYTNYTYTATSGSSGTLTLYSGSTVESQINFSGIYSQTAFTVAPSALGTSGLNNVTITTAVTNSITGAGNTSTTSSGGATNTVGAVYRFFDTRFGTHFFTSDAGEKNTVIATRSDLVEETNGFGDVAQTDTSATAVYRFFDTKFGTHFFTANIGERNTVIATRPDLTYEANSTFYEHSSMQTGDVAVYRLFDTNTGTQFLTGNQTEYNGLVTAGSSTYRPDLRSEGVAFYAPTGTFT